MTAESLDKRAARIAPTLGTMSRRRFLGTLGVAGVAMLLSREALSWQNNGGRIDVHHHFIPDPYLAFQIAHNRARTRGLDRNGNPLWTASKDLDDMDRNGTAVAVLSITTPGFGFGETNEVRKLVRDCNNAAAKLIVDHPGRFGSFATIPLADIEGALRETEYALDTLKADGIALFSSYGDKWLGNALFAPVYEELNRRKAVVFVHPITATCCANLSVSAEVPNETAMVEFATDTTRTIASLIFSGTTLRFPNITWIFSHAGGTMPMLIERFFQGGEQAEVVPGIITKGQDGPPVKNLPTGDDVLRELRKLYYDTAQAANPVAMKALRQVVPVSHILFGTDFWYRSAGETARGLTTSKVFSAEELRAIGRGNAERILPRLRG